ncbi:hypothetical protein L873DRAFT_1767959, partial [Choiromyces venosus 120613-1]
LHLLHLHLLLLLGLHRRGPSPLNLPADAVGVADIHILADGNAVVDAEVLPLLHVYHFVLEGVLAHADHLFLHSCLGDGLILAYPSCNAQCGLCRLAGCGARLLILLVAKLFGVAWYETWIVRVLGQGSFVRCDRLGLGEGSLELVFGEVEVFQGFA